MTSSMVTRRPRSASDGYGNPETHTDATASRVRYRAALLTTVPDRWDHTHTSFDRSSEANR